MDTLRAELQAKSERITLLEEEWERGQLTEPSGASFYLFMAPGLDGKYCLWRAVRRQLDSQAGGSYRSVV
jgi:hypothetical protein